MARRTSIPPDVTHTPGAPSTSALDTLTAGATSSPIVDIALDLIDPHPANPRKDLGDLTELADSIRAKGIRQNLLLVPNPDAPGRYRAVIGHRRSAAAALAGLTHAPAAIDTTLDEAAQLELMLLENVQRVDLTPIEEADGYQGLLDLGVSRAEISRTTGRTPATVRSRLKLAALPDKARTAVHAGKVTLDDALAIADLPADEQKAMAKKLGTAGFATELVRARERVKEQKVAAPLLELLAAVDATELPRDGYETPDGLVYEAYVNVRYHPASVAEELEKWRERIAPGWAYRWHHGWLQFYRPVTLEEVADRATAAEQRAAHDAEREAREAEARAQRELFEQFVRVTAETRREFLEHLLHDRKALTREQQTAVLEYAAAVVVDGAFGGSYHDGIYRAHAVPVSTRDADALVTWLRGTLPEDHKETYHRSELLPVITAAAARLTAPQVALAGFAAALEPLYIDAWRYGGRSVTTVRWYELLERLGYQVSDEERAALVVPVDDEPDEDDDEHGVAEYDDVDETDDGDGA
ncbi:ParB/RepB/Spo0J family partition protein [Cellulomonas iranensis]|uniref:ParB/RepB/Spo0J family partition protein n=1 Tax=Cellulomonas iranensis TaxID=76862 RepID=UPI000B3D3D60|nr:ParB/RepB/Spo0J family partition protein [Cellulomonas iranensis]